MNSVPDREPSTDNLYAPPRTRIIDASQDADTAQFYVVSRTKFALLYLATFGLYGFYWFHRHWKLQRIRYKLDIWPVPRAIFSIFFAHRLNREIDYRIRQSETRHSWSPGAWATLYVALVLAGRIIDHLPDELLDLRLTFGLIIAVLFGTMWTLMQSQHAANIACCDPSAERNRHLTPANYVWLILGGIFWALLLIGMLLPTEETL